MADPFVEQPHRDTRFEATQKDQSTVQPDDTREGSTSFKQLWACYELIKDESKFKLKWQLLFTMVFVFTIQLSSVTVA